MPGKANTLSILSRMIFISFPIFALPFVSHGSPIHQDPVNHPGKALVEFAYDNFVGSGLCMPCHTLLTDGEGNDMSIVNHWRSTMMANAAKDPFWEAKVASEVYRNPQIQNAIEKKCVTCHMPMAWTQKNADAYASESKAKSSKGIFADFLDPASIYHQAAMDGVSCSLCHQIQDKNLGQKESFNGQFVIDTSLKGPQRLIFGPYQTTEQYTMQTSVGFTPVYGSQMNDSVLCATCHTLFTSYLNAEDEIGGHFPEQTVFLEWQHSRYANKTGERYGIDQDIPGVSICQECHMPHSEHGEVIICKYAPSGTKPQDHFSRHFFVGGNVLMLDLLQANMNTIEPTASFAKLEDTRQRTLDQLQNRTARLTLLRERKWGRTLEIELQVESLVGHKFPAGFPSRRTWIHLTVQNEQGAVLFESGRPEPDGSITGDDADRTPGDYEPHYDEITASDQVQIYEAIMGDSQEMLTYTLLRGAHYLKDNRLLPEGFDKKSADHAIAVYGKAARDEDFVGGSDRIVYRIDLPSHSGRVIVSAVLYYTPIAFNFIRDLFSDTHLPEVARFQSYWQRTPKDPVAIAALRKEIR